MKLKLKVLVIYVKEQLKVYYCTFLVKEIVIHFKE